MGATNSIRVMLFWDSEIARYAYGPYFTGTIQKKLDIADEPNYFTGQTDDAGSSQSESDDDNDPEEGEFQTPLKPVNPVNPITENIVQQWESSQWFSNARYDYTHSRAFLDMGSGSPIDDLVESGTVRLLDWNDSMTNIQLGMRFVDKVQAAGTETKQWKFDRVMKEIQEKNIDVYIYLMKLDPEKWTMLHDGGHRHGIITTNISEALVLKKARDEIPRLQSPIRLPDVQVEDVHRGNSAVLQTRSQILVHTWNPPHIGDVEISTLSLLKFRS
ncbi:hypothetical protein M9H77_22332 [Catharanthus roseus]|uniref:Uncharacterized protein n=1 Tax=Catharanthus roseus TaxID=4058 RepID=A0ACC0AQ70_CATRO|nr:hypothetical protein M9H77_22332 [Catharanthus roseus]